MSFTSSKQLYEPLPNGTSIRVVILAPAEDRDCDIACGLITSDLDFARDSSSNSDLVLVPLERSTNADGGHFPTTLDLRSDSTPEEPRLHPFQQYEALSYVWGDLSDLHHILVNGHNVSITKGLSSALRSLRLQDRGRKLWIDALCINQSDHDEKKDQLNLMARIYQQAQRVIAYLPLSLSDQNHLSELVPKIIRATMAYREARASGDKRHSDQETSATRFNSISELESKRVIRDTAEPMSVVAAKAFGSNDHYIESFGLPQEKSPVWDSWRRLFTSPYFRRIWIWQEVTLGNNLFFWFGNGGQDATPIFLAHRALEDFSAFMNMSYNAAWCASDEDTQQTLNDRLVGSGNARTMYLERILRVFGTGDKTRLIEKLAKVGTFEATDPRDKIYAMLGLVSDGASFVEHVSYAPWDSMERTFIRFAKLFVERNEGIDVLLQAGLRDESDEWPSWVPHWDSLERTVPVDAGRTPGKTTTVFQLSENSSTIQVRGRMIDEISAVNGEVLERLQVTESGVDIMRFVKAMTSGLTMVFSAVSPQDPEQIFEQLFYVLAQPQKTKYRTTAQQEEHQTEDTGQESQEVKALRVGFREFLNWLSALRSQLADLSSEPEDDATHLLQAKSPVEFQKFQQAAMKHIHHRRLCVTAGERVGVAPKRVKAGDKVVLFEACDLHFVLRPVDHVGGHLTLEKEGEGTGLMYRLVGPAYFHMPDSEARFLKVDTEDIKIM
ncbi:HET-domain-containing protein [Xylariaceae sp. FL1272]|nr:HET-domain-containing protein [Xylariaceae sp. FL1272]